MLSSLTLETSLHLPTELQREREFQEKLPPFLYEIGTSFAKVFPSFNHVDLLAGISVAALMKMILYMKSKNKKKFRQGEEYGSAV